MKSKYILLLLFPLTFLFLSFSSLIPGVNIFDGDSDNEFIFQFKDDYNAAWRTVDSLEQQGLTRSALEVVEEIYKASKKDNNQPQFIKSVFSNRNTATTLKKTVTLKLLRM